MDPEQLNIVAAASYDTALSCACLLAKKAKNAKEAITVDDLFC